MINNNKGIARFDIGIIWLIATTVLAIIVSVICLFSGIFIVFQNIFYIPIIIACVRYHRRGFYYSLALTTIYLALIILFSNSYLVQFSALLRAASFIVIAAVITYLASIRQEKQLALNESQERYKTLVANIPGIAYRCVNDEQWTMQFISEEITRITGYPVSDFIDNRVRTFESIIHYDDKQRIKRAIFEAIAKGTAYEIEYRMITSADQIVWVAEKGKVSINSEGSAEWLNGVIIDITDKKKSQDALFKSRQMLKATVNSIGDGVITTDNFGCVTSLNRIAEEATGWSSEEAIGLSIDKVFNIVNAKTGEPADIPVTMAIEKGSVFGLANDTELIARNGTRRLIADSCSPIKDFQNRIFGAVLVFRDVSEEYRLIDRIKESERRLDRLAEQSRTVVWDVDNHGLFTYVNNVCGLVYGYQPDELINKKYFYDLHPDQGKYDLKDHAMSLFERHESFNDYDNMVKRKDGKIIWVTTAGIPILDKDGNLIGYSGSDRDVSIRKEAQNALEESELRYRSITENSFDMISIIDTSGKYLYINKANSFVLGYSQNELKKSNLLDLVHPDERSEVSELLNGLIQHNQKEVLFTNRFICNDGSYKYVENRARIFSLNENEADLLLIIGTNTTDKLLAEEQMRITHERLETLIANSGDILFVLDENLRITEYYSGHDQDLAVSPDEFLGKLITEIKLPEKSLQSIVSSLGKCLLTGEKTQVEYSLNLSNNNKQWYNLTASKIKDDNRIMIICVINNITEGKNNQLKLQRQYLFQKLVSSISTDFVKVGRGEIDSAIFKALKKAGQFFNVDRCYVFLFSDDQKTFTNTHEWCEEGVQTFIESLKSLSCDDYCWFCKQIKSSPYLLVNIEDLPPEAKHEREEWSKERIKSMLCFPLLIENQVSGFLGFDKINSSFEKDDERIRLAEAITKIITEALHRKELEEKILKSEQKTATLAMVVTANHKINQPLTVIQGYSELLKISAGQKESERYLTEIQAAIDKIKKILQSMNDIEGIEFTDYSEGTKMVKMPSED